MKLNFWQWLGVALLIVGGIWMFARDSNKPKPNPNNSNVPTATQPK